MGRQVELQQLESRILDSAIPQPCSIVGGTRIGKSSLLAAFEQIIRTEQRNDLLCLRYDLSSDFREMWEEDKQSNQVSTSAFFRNFVTRISTDLRDHPEFDHRAAQQVSDIHFAPLMVGNIRRFFRSIHRAGYWLVLILDEFDAITEYFRVDPIGWKFLRSLGEDQNNGLCYLLASRRTISTLECNSGSSSELANLFEIIHLGLMSAIEARMLVEEPIKQSGLEWHPSHSELIQRTGGNHPYCLQMICSHLFRQHERGTLPPDMNEVQLIRQLRTTYATFFDVQQRYLESIHLFEPLLRIAHGVPVHAEDRQIEELLNMGYLLRVEGERNRFQPFSLALDYYLQACGLEGKLWPVVEETETALQQLIERRYRARFGDNWFQKIRKIRPSSHSRSTTQGSMPSNWEIKCQQESLNPFVMQDNYPDLIQYASALDLKQLISQQPELFQNVFSRQAHHVLDTALTYLYKARDHEQVRYKRIRYESASKIEETCAELLHIIQAFHEQHPLLPPAEEKSQTLPQIGDTVSKRYKITGIIDKRGYIVKAWDDQMTRDVVIKFLANADASHDTLVTQQDKLVREGRILAQLRHPNLVTVYDIITDPPGMVMDWIEGGTLSLTDYSDDDSQDMPLLLFVQIAKQLCAALHYTHSKGIIHRDIKPANILLNKHNHPFLIDFGIARSLYHETISQNHLGVYSYVGTTAYSAPEQFTKPESVTAASDIFALGVVFYQLLTHRLPFDNFNKPENYQDGRLPQLEQEDIPEPLFAILREMLKQQPEQRPTARELYKRFTHYLATFPEEARL